MSWQLFLLASILFSSANGLFHRSVMKTNLADPKAQTIAFETLAGVFALVIALSRGFHLPPAALYPNFIPMIILLILAPIMTFKAFQLSEASEIGIVMTTQRFWVVVLALLFLDEKATLFKILGTVLIILGVVIISWKKQKITFSKGTLFALLAAFLYGLSYINAFYILRSFDAPSFQVFASFLPVAFLLILQPAIVSKMKFYLAPKNGLKVFFAALFDTLATLSLYFAYQLGRNAAQISPLSSTSLILTVILAAVFLKERTNLGKKITGAAVAVIGAILIILG